MSEKQNENQVDIVVVGAGTAGMSAAIYARRAGKTVQVLDAKGYGGQIVNTPDIENYPGIKHISGADFSYGLYEQASELGAKFRVERVLSVEDKGETKVVRTAKREYVCRAVILATGAKNRPLGIAREEELTGRGVSYCATCDGAFFKGMEVAVNGGGNTALEDAAYLANYCARVYLVHRRDEFRGDAKDVEALRQMENVEFVLNCTVKELIGEERLTGIRVENVSTGEVRDIPVAGLFVAIGQMPENEAFSELVELDVGGYIVGGEDCLTKTPGIYVAGDCRTKSVRQLATAAADGAVAALAAVSHMK